MAASGRSKGRGKGQGCRLEHRKSLTIESAAARCNYRSGYVKLNALYIGKRMQGSRWDSFSALWSGGVARAHAKRHGAPIRHVLTCRNWPLIWQSIRDMMKVCSGASHDGRSGKRQLAIWGSKQRASCRDRNSHMAAAGARLLRFSSNVRQDDKEAEAK
jgi:hypothetical protein